MCAIATSCYHRNQYLHAYVITKKELYSLHIGEAITQINAATQRGEKQAHARVERVLHGLVDEC